MKRTLTEKETLSQALINCLTVEYNAGSFERGFNTGLRVAQNLLSAAPETLVGELKATVEIASHEPAVFGEWYKPEKLPEYGKLVLVEPETGKTCTGYVKRYDNSNRWYDHLGNGINPKRWCELPVQEEGLPF